jgi:hypothetical protein
MVTRDYHSRAVAMTVANRPSIDRYSQTIRGTYEWVASVSYRSCVDGKMTVVLSLDLIDGNHSEELRIPIGSYPLHERQDAIDDMRKIACKYAITARVQDQAHGWQDDVGGLTHPLHPDNWRATPR